AVTWASSPARAPGTPPGRTWRSSSPRCPERRATLGGMGAQSSAAVGVSSSDSSSPQANPPIAADHPGVTELFAVLAYGEISAFYRLAEEAELSSSLRGKVAVAEMAAAEMSHFRTLREALGERGVDIYEAMKPYVRPLDAYHRSTDPS